MKNEQAKTLADQALDQLAAALEAGHSDRLRAYLGTMARFHRYSFGNILLIAIQKPDASRVAGYQAWRKLGRFVRKGEKGIVIIAPIVRRNHEEDRREVDSTAADSHDRFVAGFKAAYVFDVSQTDGEPLPELAEVTGDPAGKTDKLRGLAGELGIAVEYEDDLGGADGVSSGGRIALRRGQTPAEEFSTLAHELAHEMLHRGQDRSTTTRTIRETEAEAVAFVVCQAAGLRTNGAAADYIQLYHGDKETLAASLARIQQAAAQIIQVVIPAREGALDLM